LNDRPDQGETEQSQGGADMNNNVWIMRGIIITSLVIIMALLGAGWANLNSGLTRIETTQIASKNEFIEKTKEINLKVDILCKKLDQHDSWLRVPFDARQKYYLKGPHDKVTQ
jgi:hypothetical protein